MTKILKFRAECPQDVVNLALELDSTKVKELTILRNYSTGKHIFPDVEVLIKIKKDYFAELKVILSKIKDGHIMEKTLANSNLFTGEYN